jgi:hypothetical protein
LEVALRCNDAKRKLLGLDMPTKIAPTTPDGSKPLTLEQREIHINAILTEHFGAQFTVESMKLEQEESDGYPAYSSDATQNDR